MTHDDLAEVVDAVGDMAASGETVWRASVSECPVRVAECILFDIQVRRLMGARLGDKSTYDTVELVENGEATRLGRDIWVSEEAVAVFVA